MDTQKDIAEYGVVARGSHSILRSLLDIVSGEISGQLKMLADLATKIWQSNIQFMDSIAKLQTTLPSPDLRYTWVQDPVRFEDALGRVIPIPSEYDLGGES
ncbi:hypothetical protein VTN00DRAFT_6830 [Thermoascus crustaceus]|uniref:uncharacterized protein n=1 Tax=Thermoascus crustaceus TaxID=5088 RepID=UPI0037445E17